MDQYIRISSLNDFIFCPYSIYFHNLYENYEKQLYQDTPQINGTLNHSLIDSGNYSTSKDILQWTAVFSEKYGLIGKIDCFHIAKKSLIERKSHISEVYLGMKYQLYAQYFCLTEMGYEVEKLKLYSLDDNKVYEIPLPNKEEIQTFEALLEEYKRFDPRNSDFKPQLDKCQNCIYAELCDHSLV